MGFMTAIALTGLGLAGYGMATQMDASGDMAAAQAMGIEAQQAAEAARKRQMELEASRRRREIVRQGVLARSHAQAQAVSKGADKSSVLPGAFGGITGQTAFNLLGTNQAEQIGGQIFDANQQLLLARMAEAQAGGQMAFGQGLFSLGGSLVQNASTLGKLGTTYGSRLG